MAVQALFNGATEIEFNSVVLQVTALYNILNREGTLVVGDRLLSSENVDAINGVIFKMVTYLDAIAPVEAP